MALYNIRQMWCCVILCVFFRGIFPGGLCSIWTAIFSPNDCWWPWPAKAWQGSPQVKWSLLRLVFLGCPIWPGCLLLWSWLFLLFFLCFSSVSWFSNPFWRCAHQLGGVVQTLFGTQGIGDVGRGRADPGSQQIECWMTTAFFVNFAEE